MEIPQIQFPEFLNKEKVNDMIIEVQHQARENLKVQKTAGATQVQTIDRWWTSLCAKERSHQLKFRENVPVVQRQDTTIQNIQMIQKFDVTKDAIQARGCGRASCDSKTVTDDSMTFPFTGGVP